MTYVLEEYPNNVPPFIPNPTDVAVILIIVSHLQSEHFPLSTIADFSGSPSNIFLSISIIRGHILPLLTLPY